VDILTVGQYLRPSAWNLPVVEYATPERFERLREAGEKLGFAHVFSGPFVLQLPRGRVLERKNLIARQWRSLWGDDPASPLLLCGGCWGSRRYENDALGGPVALPRAAAVADLTGPPRLASAKENRLMHRHLQISRRLGLPLVSFWFLLPNASVLVLLVAQSSWRRSTGRIRRRWSWVSFGFFS
jgi:hypothetical protein